MPNSDCDDPRRLEAGHLSRLCARCHSPVGARCRTPRGKVCEPHLVRRDPARAALLANGGGPGRPGGPTPDVTQLITQNLKLGAPLQASALAAGVPSTTLHRWLARADSADEDVTLPYREFRDAIVRARAQGQVRHVALINQAANRHLKSEKVVVNPVTGEAVRDENGNVLYDRVWEQDWRASSFILERAYARDFGRREVIELGAADSMVPDAGGGDAGLVGGVGVERIMANLAAFKARKELEAGGGSGDGQAG